MNILNVAIVEINIVGIDHFNVLETMMSQAYYPMALQMEPTRDVDERRFECILGVSEKLNNSSATPLNRELRILSI